MAYVAEWQVENKARTPAMFLLCHGCAEDQRKIPAFLSFGEETRTEPGHIVWARTPEKISIETEWYWEEQVYLRDFIRGCALVFLMCCHGEDIVNDYVSEMTQNARAAEMPLIVFYKDKLIAKTTHCLLQALLTMLLDSSDLNPRRILAESEEKTSHRFGIVVLKTGLSVSRPIENSGVEWVLG